VRPGLDYTTVDSRYNCIFAHSQSETEAVIRDYTQSRFGRTIEYNTAFQDLAHDADSVTARVIHTDRGDEEELIRCRYLIAADGINSRVRRGLGLPVKGKDYKEASFRTSTSTCTASRTGPTTFTTASAPITSSWWRRCPAERSGFF
jgi:2-polyprenyl-6-methoxyphenol hydroxylase-like FAD-dependent oxidoreductase